jgi:acyl carrier protein
LKHVWAFDHGKVTTEDRQRALFYQQHITRERIRRECLSLQDFLDHLELSVDISAFNDADIDRVSELTFRTNQFNLGGIRRTGVEIRQICRLQGAECLVVCVKDRFGNYGLVGAMIFEVRTDSLAVDTFLLSCRALGRGIEHQMLARLGEIAKQRGLGQVELRGRRTEKNRPALDFIEGLSEEIQELNQGGFLVRWTADSTCSVLYEPDSGNRVLESARDSFSTRNSDARERISLLSSIAETLYDPQLIHKRITDNRPRPELDKPMAPPRTPVEKKIAEIYSEFLGLEEVGIHDSFFNLGGHSLLAMQVLSRTNEAFRIELDPVILFTSNFTVAELADAILKEQVRQADPREVSVLLKQLSELTDEEAEQLVDK